MSISLSEFLGVKESDLAEYGVYNKLVDRDSEYSFSYFSIKNTDIPEFQDSFKKIQTHFIGVIGMAEEIIKLNPNSLEYKNLNEKMIAALQFTEPRGLGLGYSTTYKNCKGWTREDAVNCQIKLLDQVRRNKDKFGNYKDRISSIAPFTASSIKGIGFDKHSDMIGHILLEELITYTDRVTKGLSNIETFNRESLGKEGNFIIPFYKPNYRILFIPAKLISKQYSYFNIMSVIYDVINSAEGDENLSHYVKSHYKEVTSKKKKEKKSHQNIVNKNLKKAHIDSNIDEIIAELPKYAEAILREYFDSDES